MPIHKHEPISEKEMSWVSPEHTICETLRAVYFRLKNIQTGMDISDVREAMVETRIATSMAKSMTAKLEEYKRNWRNGFWDENENFPSHLRRKPIDVLFLCWDDNANTMYRFWQCAKYLGLNSVMFKGKVHPFGYPQQAPLHPSLMSTPMSMAPITIPAPGIESLIESSHIVHLGASTFPVAAINWKRKNVVVQHGGTVYRQNPELCNDIFNQIAKATIIQCPDLLGLGAKGEQWIYYPVDTTKLKPDFSPKGSVPVIGHFPSNPEVKGTKTILAALENLANEGQRFKYIGSNGSEFDKVTWPKNIERMAKCDIIIEGCNATQGDKVYGQWGNTALEASALGCAVITHNLTPELYRNEYGCDFGPMIANNQDELKASLKHLIGNHGNLEETKIRCQQWAEQNHSIPATANRLWDKVYKVFF